MTLYCEESLTAEQEAHIRQVAPAARVISARDLALEPGLIGEIEVSYGHLPAELWPKATGLRWMQSSLAGLDALLQDEAIRDHPATLTNVHIHASSISEHLWGMCLMLTRNLHTAVLAQGSHAWDREAMIRGLGNLHGRTLCVVGLGEIGRRCAAIGKAFGMKVIGIRRKGAWGPPAPEADRIIGPADRLSAFSESRVIMVVLPHTTETVHFIGRKELLAMDSAYLLNAGRGSSVDTDALVEALRAGKVRGAGLDVTDPEPLPSSHPLWSMSNVIITPHYAGIHPGYDAEAFAVFIDNLARYIGGRPLANVVDKTRGY